MEENVPTAAGLSSFNLLEEQIFFDALSLSPGMTLFDLACGLGNYSVAACPYLGENGQIIAMDLWQEGVETLMFRAGMHGLNNILPVVGDAAGGLPVKKRSIDCCLMATIVHILARENVLQKVLGEIQNILRSDAYLAIVEFHKIKGPPGPPFDWRISPEELNAVLSASGFTCIKKQDVGSYNYVSLFTGKD